MDLSLFDHFESAPADSSSSAASSKKRVQPSGPQQTTKRGKVDEGIEERIAGTVVEKVRSEQQHVFVFILKLSDNQCYVVLGSSRRL